ncbi:hypothetical protein [Streptomyces sp. MW-W600-10]|uniref:hypothetical protein n=1 Tax=Streptomyces sp. MW-W600-10 TaxID=2829819 RepID=UPI001C46682E|nr:hypothetical protein [Streptomyces sp. MW-W600-10]MBV7248181.1 hypothetical protein [Streptomyces sp. MW-W600-10]
MPATGLPPAAERGNGEGVCRHEDRLFVGHVTGPDGKPHKIGATVRLWDHRPGQE